MAKKLIYERVKQRKRYGSRVYTYYRFNFYFIKKDNAPSELPYKIKSHGVTTVNGKVGISRMRRILEVDNIINSLISDVGGKRNFFEYYIPRSYGANDFKYAVIDVLTKKVYVRREGYLINHPENSLI